MDINSTYIGHATILLDFGGETVLTDPWFTSGPILFRRRRKPGLQPPHLPRIDLILLSHEHFDHLDPKSLDSLEKDCTVIVHSGLGKKIKRFGFKTVEELNPWEFFPYRSLKITAVPARHTRYSIGYVISGEKNIYFAGDTTLIPEDFKRIREKFTIDLAILPIGGVKIFGIIKKVMDPRDAVEAIRLISPDKVLPIHWGTFKESGLVMSMPGMPEELRSLADREDITSEILYLEEGQSAKI
ncbi:MAG: MBL fold metallo-hydrolase [Deltaproteobacteria bacterium]|nr:MBL fold metallo-hydrolase [Deltaproteobacteria bacterium]